jgi:hypothetical protein
MVDGGWWMTVMVDDGDGGWWMTVMVDDGG